MKLSKRNKLKLAFVIAVTALLEEDDEDSVVRRTYVRPTYFTRKSQGEYATLVTELHEKDPDLFFANFRLTPEQFDTLFEKVGHKLTKAPTHANPISARERLALTLRLLSSGDLPRTVSTSYRMSKSTLLSIFNETCSILWTTLKSEYLAQPSKDDWHKIADDFWETWNFPLCLGAIDGKHFEIRCPPNTGSTYFNYKNYFSMILLACVDAKYKFRIVDIGAFGRQSDGGVFAESEFGRRLITGQLDVPTVGILPNNDLEGHYAFIGDAAFPLREDLLTPFPGRNLDERKRIFNYRLSRARRIVENAFGILTSRWRIFDRRLCFDPKNAENLIGAALCLHNFCIETNPKYAPVDFVDTEDDAGNVIPGLWRPNHALLDGLPADNKLRSRRNALQLRSNLADYFLTRAGSINWQNNLAFVPS